MSAASRTGKAPMVFISWAPFCSRSDSIAKRLGGTSYMVYCPRWGSRYLTILLKYIDQSFRTLRILVREKPGTIFVMTPPVAACFPVWLYTKLAKARYVIDTHSGALLDPRWRPMLFLHRFFSRRAATTILTSQYLQDIVRRWGARTTLVSDVPVCFVEACPLALEGAFKMTLVNTFTRDEPLDLFLRAARELADVQFYVTGPLAGVDGKILNAKPKNVQFTDFLPDSQYVALLLASDAVICLTTLPHTMQRGAYEAVYLGKPIVVSDTELLRESFHKGAVHVDNTVEAIVQGVRQMKENLERYREEVKSLKAEKLEAWKRTETKLRAFLSTHGMDPSSGS